MDDPNTESKLDASAFVGSVVGGSYRVTRLIAEGGMGAVYEALHLRLNKPVAIKILAHQIASNQEALLRFRREAEVTSRLGHPHLVQVIDFGTSQSSEPYLVMECLNGEDLDQRLRRVGRLPLQAVVEITKQAASALAAAHAEGVVHRDLKPANIFLVSVPGEDDFVKILDFGVSKIKAARTKLTRASSVLGTPDYMSPEQATGLIDEVDHRADQWALGCIAWEMLAGRAPFMADDVTALFYQIIHMDPHPIAKWAPDLPSGVEPVLRRALSKQSADRFPTIKEFSRALAAAAGPTIGGEVSSEISARIPPEKSGRVTLDEWPGSGRDPRVAPEPRVPTALEEARPPDPVEARPAAGGEALKVTTRSVRFDKRYLVAGAVAVALLGLGLALWLRPAAPPPGTGPGPRTSPEARKAVPAIDKVPVPALAVPHNAAPTDPAASPGTATATTAGLGAQPAEESPVVPPAKAKTPRTGKPKSRALDPFENGKAPKAQPKHSLIEEL